MLSWSKYNYLFISEKYGFFLYNSLSNNLVKLDQQTYKILGQIEKSDRYSYSFPDETFQQKLIETKVLVADQEEERILNIRKYERNSDWYDNTVLSLTVAPTLACNFRCSYCYQHQQPFSATRSMNPKTAQRLIDFIRSFKGLGRLYLLWFGGEPLLAFDRILAITTKVKALALPFEAHLITNGFLLDKNIVHQLSDLHIGSIQITIDGPEHIHNQRRIQAGGTGTYAKIMENVDYLLNNWDGNCMVRVNIDRKNKELYPILFRELKDKYHEKRLTIYPGIIHDSPISNPDLHCQFNREETADFHLNLYKSHKIIPSKGLFPHSRNWGGCVANHRNGFVVGPGGELYKCWLDVSKAGAVIGNIWNENGDFIAGKELVAMYQEGVDPYHDPNCLECFYFPVCNGGCFNLRLRKKYFREDLDVCSRFKDKLPFFLEAYFDMKMNKKNYDFLFDSKGSLPSTSGFEIV